MEQLNNRVSEAYPYLRVKGAPAAIAYYKAVFGATERFRLTEPDGRIGHIELDLGNIVLMLSEEFPEYGLYAPQGNTGMALHLHVDNCRTGCTRRGCGGYLVARTGGSILWRA